MKRKKKASEYAYPKVRLAMLENGDTFEGIAKLLGLSTKTIMFKMNGITSWKTLEIEKLCSYYKKDYEELFKGE